MVQRSDVVRLFYRNLRRRIVGVKKNPDIQALWPKFLQKQLNKFFWFGWSVKSSYLSFGSEHLSVRKGISSVHLEEIGLRFDR